MSVDRLGHKHELPPRRHLLAGFVAALAATIHGVPFRAWPPDGEPMLLALLRDPAKARVLGQAYLHTLPEFQRTRRHLSGLVYSPFAPTPAEVALRVKARIRQEFAEGAVVAVDGWFLAVTEARLYGLAALT